MGVNRDRTAIRPDIAFVILVGSRLPVAENNRDILVLVEIQSDVISDTGSGLCVCIIDNPGRDIQRIGCIFRACIISNGAGFNDRHKGDKIGYIGQVGPGRLWDFVPTGVVPAPAFARA